MASFGDFQHRDGEECVAAAGNDHGGDDQPALERASEQPAQSGECLTPLGLFVVAFLAFVGALGITLAGLRIRACAPAFRATMPIAGDAAGGQQDDQTATCSGEERHGAADVHQRSTDRSAYHTDDRIATIVERHGLRQLTVGNNATQHDIGGVAQQPVTYCGKHQNGHQQPH